jgi:hypothetical protein
VGAIITRTILLAAVSIIACVTPAQAGPTEDATAVVTTWLDKFNAGDVEAFYAAHADGALIVDEFAPFVWGGPQFAQHWLADYMKDAEARGISGGRVDYEPDPGKQRRQIRLRRPAHDLSLHAEGREDGGQGEHDVRAYPFRQGLEDRELDLFRSDPGG